MWSRSLAATQRPHLHRLALKSYIRCYGEVLIVMRCAYDGVWQMRWWSKKSSSLNAYPHAHKHTRTLFVIVPPARSRVWMVVFIQSQFLTLQKNTIVFLFLKREFRPIPNHLQFGERQSLSRKNLSQSAKHNMIWCVMSRLGINWSVTECYQVFALKDTL